jgi:outer membrane protein OmpA-like peptidoglycan-associated protein
VRRDDAFFVSGLRDPLAAEPEAVLREAGIDTARLVSRWAPYEGLDPVFVLQRLTASLQPPPEVRLAIDRDRIVATGSAPVRWLERARLAARMLPAGSPGLDLDGVRNVDEEATAKLLKATKSLRETIQAQEVHFDSNEPLPAAGQEAMLDRLAGEIKELASLSASLRVLARVTLTGHSDDTGKGTFNLSLSLARAGAVLTLLKKRGVDSDLLAVRGAGPLEPLAPGSTDAARSANRRVSFTVGIEEQQ